MRYLLTFSYDGTNFKGYQKQVSERTVQKTIESVLSKISNSKIKIFSSGRTDCGVHALNQKAHFDLDKEIDLNKFKYSMNSLLPDDIYIKDISLVDNDFHARFNVIKKEYIYKINIGEYNPLERKYVYQYNHDLDIESMRKGLELFVGTHDFKSFTTNDFDKDTIRTIFDTNLTLNNDIITIIFIGNGFLRYMVRNMIGLLIEIGQGKRNYQDIIKIINFLDRKEAGIKAPACGLYLKNVEY